MAIRILHVLTTDGRRGAETSALMVRDELRTRGHIADAVALVAAADGAHLDIPVLGSKRLGLPTLRALRRAARGSDLVIAHGSSTLPACSIALAASGIPFVYVNIGDLEYWAGSGVKKLRTRALLRRPRAVAARSERSAQTLRTTFGVAADRVVVVPNGRPAQRYPRTDEAGRASARARWGIATDAPVVAWVGALSSEKRPDLAVRAVAAVPETLLLIAGDGPLRGEVERLAAELTPGRVRLVGTVDDVVSVYAAADLALLTSDSEGLPGVLIEAGLTGLPVVATDVGFVSDIVDDQRTGILVKPGDALAVAEAISKVYPARGAMGASAYARCAEHFSAEAVGDRWERLLRSIVRN
jgi:glycosyltransferase involved in cell wall biosynthesis